MNLRFLLFLLQWILIIHFSGLKVDCTDNQNSSKFLLKKGLFKKNLLKSANTGVSVMGIAKHLGKTFDQLIDVSPYVDDESLKNDVYQIYSYISEGFELLHNMTKPRLKYPIDLTMKSYNDSTIETFLETLKDIEKTFDFSFLNYLEEFAYFNHQTINYFLEATIYNETFTNYLRFLDSKTIPTSQENEPIFEIYFNKLSLQNNCDSAPISYKMFNLYKQTLIGVTKGYTILIIGYEFAYMLGNLPGRLINIQDRYLWHFYDTIDNILISANQVLNSLQLEHKVSINCDPHWKEGQTYIRVKNYVSNFMSTVEASNSGFKLKKDLPEEFECNNQMIYSDFKTSSVYSMTCPEIFTSNPSLHEYFCHDHKDPKEFLDSNHTNWPAKCSFVDKEPILITPCFCDKLSDRASSIRKLNLKPLYTDTTKNKVITGIKFAVQNNIIGIEIQEGEIKNGIIDPETLVWKHNDDYPSSSDFDILPLDFHSKSFDLDDLMLPYGQLFSGIKLDVNKNHHIRLAIRGTKMYDDNHIWPSDEHQWHYPQAKPYSKNREKISLEDYQHSAETMENKELSYPGRNYINLAVGIKSNTYNNLPVLPFLDSQNLTHVGPIGGAGMFYKGKPGFGGFLAFKIFDSPLNFNMIPENNS